MKAIFISILLLAVASTTLFGQKAELIEGTVADSTTLSPLQFVNIQIKGSARGASTDSKGNFRIIAHRFDTLQFSFVGYKTIEIPILGKDIGLILLAQRPTMLKSVTVTETRDESQYRDWFAEQIKENKRADRRIPFYYPRDVKDKIKLARANDERERVKTYVDLVIANPQVKESLIERYQLTESKYYDILTEFNQQNYRVMYYLTASELMSMLNRFYDSHAY